MIIDAHCDTLSKWADGISDTQVLPSAMKDDYLQVFAAFSGENKSFKRVEALIDTYDKLSGFTKVLKKSDFEKDGKKALLSVEDAGAIDSLDKVEYLYGRGVRMIGMTWNYNNHLAGSTMDKDTGLTKLGKEVLSKMEHLGITADLSHMGERSFYDVMEFAKKPVVLSHSCCKWLCNHKRNITKEQFYALKENGGVAGVNFYPPFLKSEGATMDDIIRHIDAFLSLDGEDNIGIGSDFDGIDKMPAGIGGTASVYALCEKLDMIYGGRIAKKIAGENFLRILKGNLM